MAHKEETQEMGGTDSRCAGAGQVPWEPNLTAEAPAPEFSCPACGRARLTHQKQVDSCLFLAQLPVYLANLDNSLPLNTGSLFLCFGKNIKNPSFFFF